MARNKMSLYGYALDTTPNLNRLFKNGDLVFYTDTIAPFAATNPSLSYVLTFASSGAAWQESLHVVDLARLCGYKSYWISNQHDVFVTKIASQRADISLNTAFDLPHKRVHFDEALFTLFDKINSKSSHNFFVFHMLGNHATYKKRYPDKFEKFTAQDVKTKTNSTLDDKKLNTIAQYLNSLLYADENIFKIYQKFKNDDAIIIYLSDHGESVYDESSSVMGHGFASRYTAEIPLLFIATDKFKDSHYKLWKRIQSGKDKPFMSDDLPHLIADILDVKPLEYDASKSPINSNFIKRNRVSAGVLYEKMK
ncbi:hypothetical protein LBC_00310 [Campylobacter sp. 19-13652]|nr:hypothetical protein LBC_00310 [Campylobacter sp. 19-13652]